MNGDFPTVWVPTIRMEINSQQSMYIYIYIRTQKQNVYIYISVSSQFHEATHDILEIIVTDIHGYSWGRMNPIHRGAPSDVC